MWLIQDPSQTRGSQFEGEGGPEDDRAAQNQDAGGQNDADVEGHEFNDTTSSTAQDDVMAAGEDASRANLQGKSGSIGGSNYKGEDYYQPEDVPDSVASQGNIPPDSVIAASKDS